MNGNRLRFRNADCTNESCHDADLRNLSAAKLIVCERTRALGGALRRELAEAGVRVWETRTLADCRDELVDESRLVRRDRTWAQTSAGCCGCWRGSRGNFRRRGWRWWPIVRRPTASG